MLARELTAEVVASTCTGVCLNGQHDVVLLGSVVEPLTAPRLAMRYPAVLAYVNGAPEIHALDYAKTILVFPGSAAVSAVFAPTPHIIELYWQWYFHSHTPDPSHTADAGETL